MRQLSDSDVAAIVDALEERLTSKFQRSLGKGVWDLCWKAIVWAVVFVAAYGAIKYGDKP